MTVKLPKILVVDDERIHLLVIQKILEQLDVALVSVWLSQNISLK